MPSSDDAHHKVLLRQPFYISDDLSRITSEERDLLRRQGTWLRALALEIVKPTTDAQRHFVSVAKGERQAASEHEKVWLKYCAARHEQTTRLQALISGKNLTYEQLISIQSSASDFDFKPQDIEELERQVKEKGKNRSSFGHSGFIVYSSTDGQA